MWQLKGNCRGEIRLFQCLFFMMKLGKFPTFALTLFWPGKRPWLSIPQGETEHSEDQFSVRERWSHFLFISLCLKHVRQDACSNKSLRTKSMNCPYWKQKNKILRNLSVYYMNLLESWNWILNLFRTKTNYLRNQEEKEII